MKPFWKWIGSSGAGLWAALFLTVNLAFPLSGGTNADSRFALVVALTEDHSPRLGPYREWTSDWAKTPDGAYYSNKAPGPSLLALPIYAALDPLITWGAETREARDAVRYRYKARLQKILSFWLQLIPFALLLVATGHFLRARKVSAPAFHLAMFALTFGNTSSLFFSTFFGHGFTAAAILGFVLFALDGKAGWAGLAFGLAGLSDYGVPFLVPGALIAFAPTLKPKARNFFLGLLGPALLWGLYHQSCFGSPFTIASRFQNPEFVDHTRPLWGIISRPEPEIFVKLLAGAERGILWTQPWIIALLSIVAIGCLGRPSEKKSLSQFAALGLFGLLVMNASFNGWHGGLVPGPRYLSAIFPVWALVLGLSWGDLTARRRGGLGLGLAVAGAFALLVFSTDLSSPVAPLWPHLWHQTFFHGNTPKIRFGLLVILAATAFWRIRRNGLGWNPWKAPSSESA